VRGRRRFVVCGLRGSAAGHATDPLLHLAPRGASLGVWLPGVTFTLVLAFSAYVLGRPAPFPLSGDAVLARGGIPHFSIADFANANR